MKNEIKKLYAELLENDGIVPDSWLPYIKFIKICLKMAKIFTPDNIDRMIDDILEAIEVAEKSE